MARYSKQSINFKKSMIEELQKQLYCINKIREKGLFSTDFKIWHSKCLAIIEEIFGADSSYVQNFKDITYSPPQGNIGISEGFRRKTFFSGLEQATALILDCVKYFNEHKLDSLEQGAVQFIEDLCKRFPRISKQICSKYRNRDFVNLRDEYDVQHLFHALLIVRFDDIRPEDVNPSYAGATSRVDFLLKREKIVVEVKKTRENLKDKEVGEQLIIDMKRYSQSQDCKTLICFVFDPDRLISNPHGLESDLSGRHDRIEVRVIIAPKN